MTICTWWPRWSKNYHVFVRSSLRLRLHKLPRCLKTTTSISLKWLLVNQHSKNWVKQSHICPDPRKWNHLLWDEKLTKTTYIWPHVSMTAPKNGRVLVQKRNKDWENWHRCCNAANIRSPLRNGTTRGYLELRRRREDNAAVVGQFLWQIDKQNLLSQNDK